MITHGLRPNSIAVDGLATLPPDVPALRVDVRTRGVVEVTPALVDLLGMDAAYFVGRPVAELCPVAERAALDRRLEDTVLLGRDIFGCLALPGAAGETVFVEFDTRYAWHRGQHLDIILRLSRRVLAVARGAPAVTGAVPALSQPAPAPVPAAPGAPSGETMSVAPAPVDTVPTAEARALVITALAAAGVAALAVDPAGRVASATPAAEALLGMPIARLRGACLADLLCLADVAEQALAVARQGRSRQSVAATLAADGRQVALEWLSGGRDGAGFAILACDQPESADAERLRVQTRLVSFVSHDVRDSLAAAFCSLRSLSDDLAPTSAERGHCNRALGEIQRANRIVDDVLAVSRPGSLIRAPLSLASLLNDTLARFHARATSGGVEIRARLTADVQVSADLMQLERAFGNLVENALQATPHYGTLTVTSRLEDRGRPGVCIDVSDTGVGIKADIRPNVFEPFVTDKLGGTGLGLAITWRAVRNHDGQISFDSAEGRGTTFTVWLPRL